MLLNDSVNRVEAQSRTFANRLRCEERLEDAIANLRRNSRTVVSNLNQDAAKLGYRSYQQRAALVHRVNRVIDEVGPNLVELAAARANPGNRAVVLAYYVNAVLQTVVK